MTAQQLSPRAWDRYSELLDGVISFEHDQLDEVQDLQLFQELHDTGVAYQLQGHYAQTVRNMIAGNLIRDNKVQDLLRAPRTFTLES